MDFALSDEQRMIADTARAFFADGASSARTRAAMAGEGVDAVLWTAFCTDLGLSGVAVPETAGGAGLGMVELASIAEAAGAQIAAVPLLGLAQITAALCATGAEDAAARWLPGLLAGETIAAAGAFDGDAAADGLTGQARFLPHGAAAGLFLLYRGEQAWLVERGANGVAVEARASMDETRPFATVRLEHGSAAALPRSAALAARQAGWLCLAAEALGGSEEALRRTVGHVQERRQFGRAIGSFQAVKHKLADRAVEIEQARSAVYWAACAMDEKSPEAAIALHAAKSFAADCFFHMAADMVQLHGGIGFTWEHDAHLFLKRARSTQSMLGSGSWHREQVAALMLGEAA